MIQNFALFRIAPLLVLGEDKPIVHVDVKDPGVSFYENRFKAGGLSNCGRQTGGPGKVVSTHAVGNRNFHQISRVAFGLFQ